MYKSTPLPNAPNLSYKLKKESIKKFTGKKNIETIIPTSL